jgi:gamma-glutamyltranspeptidase/glutathione hydrolase
MRAVTLKTLALSVMFVASSPVFAVALEGGAVASPDQYGAQVAAQVLKKGGNAVDAAVATAFTLAVTYPEAGNIGGGGFMTLFMNSITAKLRPRLRHATCTWTIKAKSFRG